MKVNSKEAAWNEANKIFPTDYELDQHRSENAGYGIYFSTADGINAWISDLGDRLEVNLPDGSSVNIWVMNPKSRVSAQKFIPTTVLESRIHSMIFRSLQKAFWTTARLLKPSTMDIPGLSMIGNMEALEYAECGIPDMLGSLDVTTQEYYERFVERIRYLAIRDNGFKPKYHKGQRDVMTIGLAETVVQRLKAVSMPITVKGADH